MIAQEAMVESMEPPPPPDLATDDQTQTSDDRIDNSASSTVPCLSRNSSTNSRLNAGAPEYVPRSTNRSDTPRLVMQSFSGPPASPLFHVPYQASYGGVGGGFAKQQEQEQQLPVEDADQVPPPIRNNDGGVSQEVRHKLLNQVEYYFSDANLATTDHLIKFISKDPDGFVPISVVASFRKIKALVGSHQQLAAVLRKSLKLVVSDDGKKVRRKLPLTESDMEDLQSRIVIAENLPEDHSYQNLMRVFSAVGSVKTIRTCQPQNSNGGASATPRSKLETTLFSNKLHAFVEYEAVEIAEKAVSELNDERNWRSGLRVRLMPKRTSKSAQVRGKKLGNEGEGNDEDDDLSTSEQLNDKHSEDHSQSTNTTPHEHNNVEDNDKESSARRGRGRGRGKGRGGRGQQHHNNRGSHIGTPPASNSIHYEPTAMKQPPGPRMPDGTRGFTMGRGKHIASDIA